MATDPLEQFALKVVVPARDSAIESMVSISLHDKPSKIPKTAAPEIQAQRAIYNKIAALPAEVRRNISKLIVEAIDTCIHDLLKNLDDFGYDGAQLLVDGVDVLAQTRHELHGYQLTPQGWFARFSKFGEHGDAAVP